jgi:MFS family permease
MDEAMIKHKKWLKLTILLIALFQMPSLAISPSISLILDRFPGQSLITVQTVLQLPNLISPFIALLSAFLTTLLKDKSSKKRDIIIGLSLLIATSVGVSFFHSQFWTLYIWGVLMGISIGLFLPSATGLIVDLFDADERRIISGHQTSFINGGGILMSILGGLLGTTVWYGGYLVFFLVIPVIIMCALFLPDTAEQHASSRYDKTSDNKGKFDINILYYAAIIFVFMSISTVSGSNLSVYVQDQLKLGDSATTGILTAVSMCGGTISGLFFGKLSKKLKDFVLPFAFFVLFLGYLINSQANSVFVIAVGAFLLGSTMSMVMPQCIYSISLYVNERSSSLASSLGMSVAPSLGGFVSPGIYTSITQWLSGDSVSFRYLFTGFVALFFGVLILIFTVIRKKRGLES